MNPGERPRSTAPRLWLLVSSLGIAQIISWGTLYYSIAVLGANMRRDLGISETTLFGAYSFSLLLSGIFAPAAGRAIDRWGGRNVMSAGSLIAAVSLFAIGQTQGVVWLYVAWALGGVAMTLALYEPAFVTLSQHTGNAYRRALTVLTLFGGLASTAFWPLSLAGLSTIGWRDTMTGFALLELLVCLPLHFFCIPKEPFSEPASRDAAPAAPVHPPATTAERHRARRAAFVALATAFALNGFVVSAIGIHLIAVLQGKAFTLASAVWVSSFIGPMQVAGRAAEFTIGRRFASRTIGILSYAAIALALMLLIPLQGAAWVALLFALLYGASNGVLTIVRGIVPAELFGRVGFGGTLGALVAPSLIGRAIAPLVCAGMVTPGPWMQGWLIALGGLSVLAVIAFAVAVAKR
ncbi:MAG TPA: MFS transporter [Casimicrobiaceae bacterium]|nr:MFS transporter [Casimicrobiaceae bacterium]